MVEIGIEPLVRLLGFSGLEDVRYGEHTAAATLGGVRTVAVLIAGWADPLDGLWRLAVVEARRREAEWCLLFNGLHMRLVDAGRVYSRRYVDLDLDEAADEAPTAAALWTLCAAPAFVREPDGTTPIRRLVTASERHGADVCRSLRAGVLEASADVMRAMLVGQPRDRSGAFEQALTVVYRILFLLFAEARALVPMWHPIYRESYSLEALREAAERSPMSTGLWDALRAVSRMAHAGCHAGDLRVTAVQRPAVRRRRGRRWPSAAISTVTRSAGRSCRWARGPRPIARAASGSRTAISAWSSSARCTRRCSTTSRALNGIGSAARVTLQRGSDAAKDNRIVLHAPADRPLSGPARRSRRSSTRRRRSASSS